MKFNSTHVKRLNIIFLGIVIFTIMTSIFLFFMGSIAEDDDKSLTISEEIFFPAIPANNFIPVATPTLDSDEKLDWYAEEFANELVVESDFSIDDKDELISKLKVYLKLAQVKCNFESIDFVYEFVDKYEKISNVSKNEILMLIVDRASVGVDCEELLMNKYGK